MIIGNRETFIGIKKSSIISTEPFYSFSEQKNYTNKIFTYFSFKFIQTGQDP